MICYYELLGVTQDVSASELKKAYRRLALQWHPDKNLNNLEEANQRFSLIQHAYDILSDPHEKAWYDSHRESILRGFNLGTEVASDGGLSLEDLLVYFSPSAFSGFDDSIEGFYTVYHAIFKKIAHLEPPGLPTFGRSDWDYVEKVKPFYEFWQSFITERDFSWFDKFKVSDASDRRVRRMMEKDNKKLREVARKEYSATVRRLTQYLRKRDPRHKRYVSELERLNKVKKDELEYSKKQLKQVPPVKEAKELPAWTQFTESDLAELDQLFKDWETDSILPFSTVEQDPTLVQEANLEDLYCAACDKEFSFINQLHHHQTTKKHLKSVERLRIQLIREENQFLS